MSEHPEPELEIQPNEPTAPEGGEKLPVPTPKADLSVGERGYIMPTNVEEAARMAKAVIVAGLAPSSYDNDPNKILLGIMSAMEAGLQPLYGLRQIAIINGRPVIWGDAAIALVQSKNLVSEYVEAHIGEPPNTNDLSQWPDDFGFRVDMKRRGQTGTYTGTFTVGMAKRANLWLNSRKKPWIEHPERMLKIRARAIALRDGFADALAGLAIREEVEDFPVEKELPKVLTQDDAADLVEAPPMPVATDEETGSGEAADY